MNHKAFKCLLLKIRFEMVEFWYKFRWFECLYILYMLEAAVYGMYIFMLVLVFLGITTLLKCKTKQSNRISREELKYIVE